MVTLSIGILFLLEPGSSGSVVSGCGLDDRAIGVRSPAGAKDFSSSLCVQTGSEAHPASCTTGTRGPFSRGKARPGRDADHSPPSSAEVLNEELYLLSPQAPPWRVAGLLYLLHAYLHRFIDSQHSFGWQTLRVLYKVPAPLQSNQRADIKY
jgi:hypothetical protein